jgi:hypothetical protein
MEVEGKLRESTCVLDPKFLLLSFTFSAFSLLKFWLVFLQGWDDGGGWRNWFGPLCTERLLRVKKSIWGTRALCRR